MKTYTEGELNEILRKHKLWLADDPSGERANLTGANLWGANLWRADLTGANLWGANLTGANLWGADLTRADLTRADLTGADLTRADLTGANLWGANLWGANLWGADLTGANLWGADLTRADLTRADLKDVKDVNYPMACPEEGAFIGFKKCRGDLIVKLQIPKDALRSSASSRKCRCNKAEVLSITNIDGTDADVKSVQSGYDSDFVYTVGKTVKVSNFDENRWNECAPGIHFFITRREAVEY